MNDERSEFRRVLDFIEETRREGRAVSRVRLGLDVQARVVAEAVEFMSPAAQILPHYTPNLIGSTDGGVDWFFDESLGLNEVAVDFI